MKIKKIQDKNPDLPNPREFSSRFQELEKKQCEINEISKQNCEYKDFDSKISLNIMNKLKKSIKEINFGEKFEISKVLKKNKDNKLYLTNFVFINFINI